MYVFRNIDAPSYNHCCSGKAMSITYSECVSAASVTPHAIRMRRITLSAVACLLVPYFFPHCLINITIFMKYYFREKSLNIKCVF